VPAVTKTEAYEAILRHHALLGEQLDRRVQALRRAVEEVPEGPGYEPAVAELVAFLAEEVLPHAAAEEQTIYPAAATHDHLTEVVDQMVGEHKGLAALTEALASARSGVAAAAAGDEIVELFGLHVAKENELLLPPLVSDEDVDLAGLLSKMHSLTEASKHIGRADEEFPSFRVEEVLLSLLLEATGELARAGQGDRACELAAAAWTRLRGTRPDLAMLVTTALHRLARASTSEPVALRAPASNGASADADLDVRALAPAKRHEVIFATYAGLEPGGAFVLVNDHDPKPLYYQFEAEHPREFSWDYLESGPRIWRVRIGRTPAEALR
jgi:uncharacterized protein (DUF2249 family)